MFVAVQCCGGISTQRILLTPRWSSISVSMTVFFEPWHEAEANGNHLITKVSLWETWRQPNNWIIKSKECIMLLATLKTLQKLNAIWSNWLLDYVISVEGHIFELGFFLSRTEKGLVCLQSHVVQKDSGTNIRSFEIPLNPTSIQAWSSSNWSFDLTIWHKAASIIQTQVNEALI